MKLHPKALESAEPRRRGVALVAIVVLMMAISAVIVMLQISQVTEIQSLADDQKEDLKKIIHGLRVFYAANGRVPCPAARNLLPSDTNDGVEVGCAVANASITSVGGARIGAVPFRTLNLPSSLGEDRWGGKLLYAMTTGLGNAGTYAGTAGVLSVTLANGIVKASQGFLVLSHGPSGLGRYARQATAVGIACDTARQDGENCNEDVNFTDFPWLTSLGNDFFDDIIYYEAKF
jgi:hypothetical protein